MVRNFKMLKWVLPLPTRRCLKNTGPGESALIHRAIIPMGMASTMVAARDRIKSRMRFT